MGFYRFIRQDEAANVAVFTAAASRVGATWQRVRASTVTQTSMEASQGGPLL